MTRPVLRTFFCASAFTLVAGGCSSQEQGEGNEQALAVRTAPTVAEVSPPPEPEMTIRVLDGDTAKPVRRALVSVRGQQARTDSHGLVGFAPARRHATVRVSARRYSARSVQVRITRGVAETVRIWRTAAQWPVYGADPARTQAHGGIKVRPPFRIAWKRNLGSLVEFPAVTWNGVAYVSNVDGVLRALSIESGKILWKRRIGTRAATSPAIDPERGVLVVTTMSPGYVNALSMKTGHVRWRFYTGRAEPSPVVRDGVAYFAAANGNVYALDLDTRRPRWVFHGGVKITSSPALVGDRLYVGDYAGRVFALNVRTGARLWTGSAGSRVYGTVAVAGGRVFAPSVFSGLSALSARSGRLLWRIPTGAYLYSSPAAYKGRVYFGSYTGRVYCASGRSGRILWSGSAGGAVSGAVQVVSGVVYAASFGSRITAWNWRTGKPLWTFPRGRYVPVSGAGDRLLLHGRTSVWAVEEKRTTR
jgi:outer membrane protein assembly factor BamB